MKRRSIPPSAYRKPVSARTQAQSIAKVRLARAERAEQLLGFALGLLRQASNGRPFKRKSKLLMREAEALRYTVAEVSP